MSIFDRSILHVVAFEQIVTPTWKNNHVSNSLTLGQTITLVPNYQRVNSQLQLSEQIVSPARLTVSHHLNLLSAPKIGKSQNLSVYSILSFGSHQYRNKYASISHSISFSQYLPHFVGSNLTLSHSIIGNATKPIVSSLLLSENIILNIVKLFPIHDQILLLSSVSGFIPTDKYIATSIPIVNYPNRPTFITLIDSNNNILKLKNPEFDNQDKIEHARINKKSRGGNVIIYHDPIWPETESFSYKFKALKQTDVKALLQFNNNNLGTLITLIDYENQRWEGIITNPDFEAIEISPNSFESGFDFQVVNPLNQVNDSLVLGSQLIHS